jgi:hypothetical protein
VRLFHPGLDRWEEHFAWDNDGVTALGRTAIGRATVQGLAMNGPRQIAARPYWRLIGLFP